MTSCLDAQATLTRQPLRDYLIPYPRSQRGQIPPDIITVLADLPVALGFVFFFAGR